MCSERPWRLADDQVKPFASGLTTLKRVTPMEFGYSEAGAYTRPLFSSTGAVSNIKYTLNTP